MNNDAHFIQMALALAEKGRFSCQPNPMVGCVITQGDEVIGQGFHQKAGQNHAEINAIENAEFNDHSVVGASVYVTLEPCSHTGKTPPCAEALIKAQVARVIVAMKDPNPLVKGKGLEMLSNAGIKVDVIGGVDGSDSVLNSDSVTRDLQIKAYQLNRAFFHKMQTGRPYVVMKVATTMDGRTADFTGESQWITGADARNDVQYCRAASCAVLTGAGTQKFDDPSLNVRLINVDRQPFRILLKQDGCLSTESKIVAEDKRLILVGTQKKEAISAELLTKLHDYIEVPKSVLNTDSDIHSRIDLKKFMDNISQLDINQLMIEAGATLSGAFLKLGLVDEIVQYIAPNVLGNKARAAFDFMEPITLAKKIKFKIVDSEIIGQDIKIVYQREA